MNTNNKNTATFLICDPFCSNFVYFRIKQLLIQFLHIHTGAFFLAMLNFAVLASIGKGSSVLSTDLLEA